MSEISYRKYIGLPFKSGGRDFFGVDCYGLIVLIYEKEKGLHLWDTSDYDMSDYVKRDYMLSNYHRNWVPIDVDKVQELDVLLFVTDPDLPNIPTHVSLYMGENRMIHCMEDVATYTCQFKKGPMDKFFHSAYRHKGMVN